MVLTLEALTSVDDRADPESSLMEGEECVNVGTFLIQCLLGPPQAANPSPDLC